MEENTDKKFEFTLGIFDEITEKIKTKIKKEANNSKTYGVGVYTDRLVIENFMTYPSRTLDERIENVKKLKGVNFTFSVDTSDSSKLKDIIENAYNEYLSNSK